jgi:hypothetical protein
MGEAVSRAGWKLCLCEIVITPIFRQVDHPGLIAGVVLLYLKISTGQSQYIPS